MANTNTNIKVNRNTKIKNQKGFVLIISLVLLVVISLLVVNGMGLTSMGERMSGNQMDRTRAQMAAEQALTQGVAVLQANGDTCLADGCTGANLPDKGVTAVSPATAASAAASAAWSDASSVYVTTATGQGTTAKYSITWQSDDSFTPVGSSKELCKAYTVTGRGVGLSSKSVVVLQTVAFVCPTT
jgi:type IV pilus assembly protein PilX